MMYNIKKIIKIYCTHWNQSAIDQNLSVDMAVMLKYTKRCSLKMNFSPAKKKNKYQLNKIS